MEGSESTPNIDSQVLLEIIRTQTEIAKLGADLSGVVTLAAEHLQELTNAEGAVVELTEGDEMVYRAASGMAEPLLGLHLSRKGTLSGLCLEREQVLRCEDTETDERVDRAICRMAKMRSMVVSPLKHNGIAIGVLKIMSSMPHAFQDDDVQILELMSDLIAAMMFHAARYETDELFHRATHDTLTGLANRALFYDRLRHHVSLARRQSSQLGILMLDMDRLKSINDTYGHRAGDAALRETAARIAAVSRQSDTIARLGGDEFGVILSKVTTRESALLAADRISEEIRLPFQFEGKHIPLDASTGVAIYPLDGSEIEALIEAADQSMYAIKRTKGSR